MSVWMGLLVMLLLRASTVVPRMNWALLPVMVSVSMMISTLVGSSSMQDAALRTQAAHTPAA